MQAILEVFARKCHQGMVMSQSKMAARYSCPCTSWREQCWLPTFSTVGLRDWSFEAVVPRVFKLFLSTLKGRTCFHFTEARKCRQRLGQVTESCRKQTLRGWSSPDHRTVSRQNRAEPIMRLHIMHFESFWPPDLPQHFCNASQEVLQVWFCQGSSDLCILYPFLGDLLCSVWLSAALGCRIGWGWADARMMGRAFPGALLMFLWCHGDWRLWRRDLRRNWGQNGEIRWSCLHGTLDYLGILRRVMACGTLCIVSICEHISKRHTWTLMNTHLHTCESIHRICLWKSQNYAKLIWKEEQKIWTWTQIRQSSPIRRLASVIFHLQAIWVGW